MIRNINLHATKQPIFFPHLDLTRHPNLKHDGQTREIARRNRRRPLHDRLPTVPDECELGTPKRRYRLCLLDRGVYWRGAAFGGSLQAKGESLLLSFAS